MNFTARADFIDALGVGARAIALGSAYTAVADDLSAVYYNPAGLAQIENHQIMLGYFWSKPNLRARSPDPSFHPGQVVSHELQTPIIAMGFNLDRSFEGKLPLHTRGGLINSFPDNYKSIYRLWDTLQRHGIPERGGTGELSRCSFRHPAAPLTHLQHPRPQPDFNKHVISSGLGYSFSELPFVGELPLKYPISLDAFFQWQMMEDRTQIKSNGQAHWWIEGYQIAVGLGITTGF